MSLVCPTKSGQGSKSSASFDQARKTRGPMGIETDVLFERDGAVAWITFNRPEVRNSMTFEMYERIVEICDEVEANPDIRVMVLQGAGDKAFVSGTDISQFAKFTEPEHALEYEARIDRVL